MAAPMLLVEPVISAVFPSSCEPICFLHCLCVCCGPRNGPQGPRLQLYGPQGPVRYARDMSSELMLTAKGAATRARIVAAAADLVLARGVGGTSLNDIRAGTGTSKSQLFHYFPGGKSDIARALADFQSERVLDAQRPFLDTPDTWAAWEAWRNAVVS